MARCYRANESEASNAAAPRGLTTQGIMRAMNARDVLAFWFGADPKAWFEKNPAFDEEIRSRFLPLYESAARGELAAWRDEPASCLALVILLDQFPRNLFRGNARAFATDARAREAARVIVARGWDKSMTPEERTFAYLPFEHSEALEDQELSMRLFEGNPNFEWARKHWEIIRRFGRFPHRNAALGRASTPEEIAFLKEPGSNF
jgi:uncharacterized protein (DUF924 family)